MAIVPRARVRTPDGDGWVADQHGPVLYIVVLPGAVRRLYFEKELTLYEESRRQLRLPRSHQPGLRELDGPSRRPPREAR